MSNSPDKFPKNSFSLPHQEYNLPVSKRKVIKNLKDNLRNADVMSNRLKVLTSQEEYNRIRIKIENIKLQRHIRAHQSMLNSRKYVHDFIKTLDRSDELKQRNQKARIKLKTEVSSALERMRQQRQSGGKECKQKSKRSHQKIQSRKIEELQRCRNHKKSIVEMQIKIKDKLSSYIQQKKQHLSNQLSQQKLSFLKLSMQQQKKVEQLMKKQQELINKNSQSLKSSRLASQRYQQLIHKKKQRSFFLPGLKKSKRQSHTTATE